MKLSTYIKCPSCQEIFNDPDRNLSNLGVPAPCCGALNETRAVWPSLDVHMLLDIIEQQKLDTYNGQRIAIVFTCTLLEMMLEQAVWTLIQYQVKTDKAGEALLESYQGRERRLRLFQKLNGFSLKDVLADKGYKTFLSDWKELAQIRNRIVHNGSIGNSVGMNSEEINNLIIRLKKDSMGVFTLINNEVVHFNRISAN